ncbi:phosphonate ABC transporter, permease protein PhnE [Paragemmobacter straminiformis]|uniref:Phosphonate ABC transporter, permease protein PhnE n=1 Tax=Paragemmobacter straminiformis TaxID=2045119 RepID=A0A842IAJ2_9RHOB|nr:phosphonate ABC transporter, permease protein PhnE [Gemmobacter straminiformis]MBC2836880.1 phosphonate ABC transporter, permease protein PhnE [Gemmobacter straminiformis]
MTAAPLPPRFRKRGLVEYAALLTVGALVISSLLSTAPQADALGRGLARLVAPSGLLAQMVPPDLSRVDRIAWKLLETLQMAVAGAALGLVFALPFAILATDRLSPHPLVRMAARAIIALFRTIPDLVWAIFFIIMVGLGPAAGVLAIMVDKIGFAGRFFAEAMEEADTGPQDALRAMGASRLGIIFSAVIPACLPSFTATSLFALEKAVRGSAALGLVGAGGIGVDLKVAFDLFNYDEALTIILMLLALVLIVEQGSGWIRSKLI